MELTESQIQEMVVEDLEIYRSQGKIRCFTAIPNSTWTPSWSVKVKNKRLGVRPGLPDLLIVGWRKILFLELKKKKGILSNFQKEWIDNLNNAGYCAKTAYGYDDAKMIIAQELL